MSGSGKQSGNDAVVGNSVILKKTVHLHGDTYMEVCNTSDRAKMAKHTVNF